MFTSRLKRLITKYYAFLVEDYGFSIQPSQGITWTDAYELINEHCTFRFYKEKGIIVNEIKPADKIFDKLEWGRWKSKYVEIIGVVLALENNIVLDGPVFWDEAYKAGYRRTMEFWAKIVRENFDKLLKGDLEEWKKVDRGLKRDKEKAEKMKNEFYKLRKNRKISP